MGENHFEFLPAKLQDCACLPASKAPVSSVGRLIEEITNLAVSQAEATTEGENTCFVCITSLIQYLAISSFSFFKKMTMGRDSPGL